MIINFLKMHGLGNDFVVIDMLSQNFKLYDHLIKHIADRRLGVGCDQILVLEPPRHKDSHFFYRIFNADGIEVEQCGNGARCAARFFFDAGYVQGNKITADCLAGNVEFFLEPDDNITMKLPKPIFKPSLIPFLALEESLQYPVPIEESQDLGAGALQMSVLSLGNPHAVLVVPSMEAINFKKIAPFISQHPQFPNQVNVSIMQILDRQKIRLRVWERGVGETLACGSAAVASAIAGIRLSLLKSPVSVVFRHGTLVVEWAGSGSSIYLSGSASSVYAGRFRI